MAKVVAPITARVEVIGKLKDGSYGQYRSVLFLDQAFPKDSDEAKIWKSLSPEEVSQLSKGALVQLIPAGKDKAGNDKHNIVVLGAPLTAPSPNTTTAPIAPAQAQVQGWSDDRKRQMAASAEQLAKFYRYCYDLARQQMAGVIDDPALIKEIGTTVFIETMKRL